MLKAIFGNQTMEKVLYYLFLNSEGYARAISLKLGIPLNEIQKQLKRLETGQVAESRLVGRTRMYQLSRHWPMRKELENLLDRAVDIQDRKAMSLAYTERKRPRRAGKP